MADTETPHTPHTPIPWRVAVDDCREIVLVDVVDAQGQIVCELSGEDEQNAADAAFIVRAVNAHEALVAALREVEQHCPCGARPESPLTHPHVMGCPVGRALAIVEGK